MSDKAYIFYCFTPYHLMIASSYAEKLDTKISKVLIYFSTVDCEEYINKFGIYFSKIIYIKDTISQKNVSFLKRQVSFLKCYGWLFNTTNAYKEIIRYKKQVLCIFSDQQLLTQSILRTYKEKKIENTVVLFDEGTGLYNEAPNETVTLKRKLLNMFRGTTIIPYIGYSKEINAIIAKNPEKLPFSKSEGRNIYQQSLINYNVSVMIKLFESSISKDKIYCLKKQSKHILYLGEPMREINLPENNELNLLEKFISNYVDYLWIIKPHPRDNYKKYDSLKSYSNVILLNNPLEAWLPIESYINYVKPLLTVSPISSAGLSFKKNIPAIFTIKMLTNNPMIYESIEKNHFYNTFFINDIYGLETILKTISSTPINEIEENSDIEFLNSIFKR